MPEIDYVIPEDVPLLISQEALFNIADLYKHIKTWFDFHGYDFYEKEYHDINEQSKSMKIKWEGERKIDDYLRVHIKVGITFSNIVSVKTKSGITNKGKVKFKFVSFMEKDYDEKWSNNFISKFIREVYDRFIIHNQINERMDELKNETYEIYNEVKAFLRLHMYKG
jgi:dTDP-glucose pyrophosphorylase